MRIEGGISQNFSSLLWNFLIILILHSSFFLLHPSFFLLLASFSSLRSYFSALAQFSQNFVDFDSRPLGMIGVVAAGLQLLGVGVDRPPRIVVPPDAQLLGNFAHFLDPPQFVVSRFDAAVPGGPAARQHSANLKGFFIW
jgi:hypothetical protein